MQSIEGLATSAVSMCAAESNDWRRLRQQVSEAQRPSELDLLEDQIDAVLCAYIALYATRRPKDVTIYGDYPANGYILTPTLPPDVKPAPRKIKSKTALVTGEHVDALAENPRVDTETNGALVSVSINLPRSVMDTVRKKADERHSTPESLLHNWIAANVSSEGLDELPVDPQKPLFVYGTLKRGGVGVAARNAAHTAWGSGALATGQLKLITPTSQSAMPFAVDGEVAR